jgi:phage terminase small subunit
MGKRTKALQPSAIEEISSALNDRQELFVNEYLKCFNATKAAKAAGYSEDTAYSQGHRLLKNAEVASRVRERLNQSAMEADEVLYHLASIARGDVSEVVDDNGNPDVKMAKTNGATLLIKRIKTRTVTTADKDGAGSDIVENEIELHDRLRALELIGKHHKLFTDKQEISGTDGKPIPVLITGMSMDEL